MPRPVVRMNDGRCPSQTVESSPVSVGYHKMDGHLEDIAVQLEQWVAHPYMYTHRESYRYTF